MSKRTKILVGLLACSAIIFISGIAIAACLLRSYGAGRRHFQEGYAAILLGRDELAIAELTAALQCRLDRTLRAAALADRGYCEARQHQNASALADFAAALRLDKKLAFAYAERSSLRLAQGDQNGAWDDSSRAISLNPNAYAALFTRGNIAAYRQQWDAAIDDFSEAIRSNPNDPAAYVCRGQAFKFAKRFGEALASFESAIRTAPGYAPAYLNRGYLYHQGGDLYKAIADYTKTIELAPDWGDGYRARLRAFSEKKNWRGAAADCTELLRINPRDELALHDRGVAYYLAGDDQPAISDFTDLIRISQSQAAYELRAVTLTRAGRDRDALADYQVALHQDGQIGLRKRLPWLLATCPDPTIRNADEALSGAIADCVATEWRNWSCLDTLAASYAAAGDFAQAVKYQEQALGSAEIPADERPRLDTRLALYKIGIPYRETRKDLMPHNPPPARPPPRR